MVSATKPPTAKEAAGAILSPDGFKRYFVVHGGLFSKDEVTLDDIRQIRRVGQQPGTEGLMCKSAILILCVIVIALTTPFRRGNGSIANQLGAC